MAGLQRLDLLLAGGVVVDAQMRVHGASLGSSGCGLLQTQARSRSCASGPRDLVAAPTTCLGRLRHFP
eukprot:CAMPEP_0181208046 /NCGR_PEP_ID=MMETSP1096-20121128/21913_1 /TAXON_ID=156174 ORGANISM="Chrysochromulina ericina, Strain CCMP281" /NCGR_SAMPLE_ID=MMETSP1096 /ASSEMBLY_ACC=CAM_ASM_000453 /LENGTH=67 /DNA_ID=CAMNT_0023299093 /DNA_START=702 /DNA_END=901 /DNA_ORIENTATION=-